MKQLIYTRIEYRSGEQGKTVKRSSIRVEKAPAMPSSVEQLSDTDWRRVTTSKHLEVIEAWRLLEAPRAAA